MDDFSIQKTCNLLCVSLQTLLSVFSSMFAPTPVPPGSNQLALPGPGMGTHGGRDPLPGPGLPGGQLSLPAPSLSALNAASAASAGDDPTRPPAYVPDPLPPSIQQSAAAAAAARLAKVRQ